MYVLRQIDPRYDVDMIDPMYGVKTIDPSYFLSVNNTPAAAKTSSALDVSRFRSELDLTFGSSSNNSAKYGSWAHGLAAPPSKDRAMSAYGDLTSLRRPSASDPRRRFAKLQVSISYAPTAQRLEIEVLRVEDVSDALIRSGIAAEVVVHASILPSKRSRFKTKAKPITNAAFHERWVVRNVSKKELFMQQLRFRLYSHEFLGMGRILGETVVDVMSFDLEEVANSKWLTFTPAPEIKKLLNL
ncbi:predicted protein [Nematostella vectensis]|uniref:C2 domain-containing protein n=1 Tax=Nematostella vectensis TaxID=45351 RepID=A7S7R5_NEMVE|nr:predicted protein [Nematostella vectensis]|eukprot:XP_001632347.1 predicted protein [Nematostella vectensis]